MPVRKRILIVDDEQTNINVRKIQLAQINFEVAGTAVSGLDAVKKADELKPDLVLMDIGIYGEMDGVEAAFIIKNKYSIPVIFITAYNDEATIQRAQSSEPYGYIIKPYNTSILSASIQTALRLHEVDKQNHVVQGELYKQKLELEKQNEELKCANDELEVYQKRYFELFNSASMGYFYISKDGLIIEANIAAAGYLGVERDSLINKLFYLYIMPADLDIYYMHQQQLLESELIQEYELRITCCGSGPLRVWIESSKLGVGRAEPMYRFIIKDIDMRKQTKADCR